MKNVCPSCGSSLPETATVCSNCGEEIVAPPLIVDRPPTGPGAERPVPSGEVRYCTACGTANPSDANFCSSCGTPVAGAGRTSSGRVAAGNRSGMTPRGWFYATVSIIALAALIYVVSTPEEVKGPPTTEMDGGAAGVPPGHPDVSGNQAMSPEQKRQMEEMKKHLAEQAKTLRGALDADPGNDSLSLQLANVYYELGQFAEALPLYKAYLKTHPKDPDVRTDLAFVIANMNDVDGAILELKQVVSENPGHQNSAYNLAMMYVAKRNSDSTIAWLKRVIEIDSTSPQATNAAMIIKELSNAHPGGGMPSAGPLPESRQ